MRDRIFYICLLTFLLFGLALAIAGPVKDLLLVIVYFWMMRQ